MSLADNFEDILELFEIEIQPLTKITKTGGKSKSAYSVPFFLGITPNILNIPIKTQKKVKN